MEEAKKKIKCTNAFQVQRVDLFFSVFEEIFEEYEQILKDEQKIDFNDMISMAVEQIKNRKYIVPFDYIIVDEYQDMSFSRQKLLEALILQKDNTKLFGVGDDWQSIYGFTGSDIDYFINFDKYWPHSLQLKIEKTHRNSQQLVNIAGQFVMRNSKQIHKDLKADLNINKPILILHYEDNKMQQNGDNDKLEQISASNYAVLESIECLKKKLGDKFEENELLILARNNTTIEEIKTLTQTKYKYSTVHRSKGAEAKAVIIADVLDGIAGFPNQMTDDSILQSLLAEPEEYQYAQERRLFYVALTRTKTYVAITTPEQKVSSFINEIETEKDSVEIKKVSIAEENISHLKPPVCKLCKGKMVLRQNREDKSWFWGCSNYSNYYRGCRYTMKYDI